MIRDSIESIDLNCSIPSGARRTPQIQHVLTPRPTPKFFVQAQTFSTKKVRSRWSLQYSCYLIALYILYFYSSALQVLCRLIHVRSVLTQSPSTRQPSSA